MKGRGNRRYRPEDGRPAEAEATMGTINGTDRQDRDEHRSKHKHHRHHRHRPRDRDGNIIEPSGSGHMSPDRCDMFVNCCLLSLLMSPTDRKDRLIDWLIVCLIGCLFLSCIYGPV